MWQFLPMAARQYVGATIDNGAFAYFYVGLDVNEWTYHHIFADFGIGVDARKI